MTHLVQDIAAHFLYYRFAAFLSAIAQLRTMRCVFIDARISHVKLLQEISSLLTTGMLIEPITASLRINTRIGNE